MSRFEAAAQELNDPHYWKRIGRPKHPIEKRWYAAGRTQGRDLRFKAPKPPQLIQGDGPFTRRYKAFFLAGFHKGRAERQAKER